MKQKRDFKEEKTKERKYEEKAMRNWGRLKKRQGTSRMTKVIADSVLVKSLHVHSEPATVSDGTSASKRARLSDALSWKHGESSTLVMGKTASEEIDENVCCVCFTTFEEDRAGTGAEWLPRPCGKKLRTV